MTKKKKVQGVCLHFLKLLTEWIWGTKKAIQYYCTPRMCRIPKCASTEKLPCIEVFQEVQRARAGAGGGGGLQRIPVLQVERLPAGRIPGRRGYQL